MVDEKTKELLELEYVDDLETSLCNPSASTVFLKMIFEQKDDEWLYEGRDQYQAFSEIYDSMRSVFEITKRAVQLADDRTQEYTPHFKLLKGCMYQIDTSIASMAPYFGQPDNNTANFRERFVPYAGYLDVILSGIDGIKQLNHVYSDIVDTHMLAERFCTKGKKAQE